jgi:hypothetical protein
MAAASILRLQSVPCPLTYCSVLALFRNRQMYFHKQIFKAADVIVSPMTGYYYYYLLLQLSRHTSHVKMV